jgi:nitroreductase
VLVFSDPLRYLARYSQDDKIAFGRDDLDLWPVRFWDVDAAMAAMQLQLAAVDKGLATWFFGIAYGQDAVLQAFSVPEDRRLVGVIAIGYQDPKEVRKGSGVSKRRRPLEEQLHTNTW